MSRGNRNKNDFDRNFPPLVPMAPKSPVSSKRFHHTSRPEKLETRRSGQPPQKALDKNSSSVTLMPSCPNSWSDDEVRYLTNCQISELQEIVDGLPGKKNNKEEFRMYLANGGLLEAMSSALMSLRMEPEIPKNLLQGFCEKFSQNFPEKGMFETIMKEKEILEKQLVELAECSEKLTEEYDRRTGKVDLGSNIQK